MAIFHYFLFDFQIVKTSLPCHYAIFKQLLDTFAVSAFFDDFFQNFTARIFARARKENDFQEFAQILMGAGGLMSPQNDYIFIFFMLVRVRKCVELFY